jgi:hypothetical protein
MTLNKTTIALEIVVLFGCLIAIEWLAHALTDTQNMFVPGADFGNLHCSAHGDFCGEDTTR